MPIVKTRFTYWCEFELTKGWDFANHCDIIITHIDKEPKKNCLFLLGEKGVLTVPYTGDK